MPKKDDYSSWQGKIKAAIKFRDKIITEEDFKCYNNYFKGRFWKERTKRDRVEVNMVYSITNVMMSALASRDPWIAFKARQEEFKSRETVCEEALNNTMTDIGFRFTLQDVIRDAQLNGYGVGKCGYTFDTETSKAKDKQGEQPEYNLHIKKEAVYFNLIEPRGILLDPTSTQGIRDSKFVIEVLIQNKDYIEEKYGVDLQGVSVGIPAFLKDKFDDLDKETQRVFDMCIFYEIWDIKKKKRGIMIEGYADKVLWFDWPYGLDDYPYELLIFNRSPGEPYGISDVSLYRTQQEELNTLRSTEADHTKKNNARWQAVADAAELKEIKKFLSNETGVVVGVKEANAISPIQPHQMANDFAVYEERIVNDIQETMGVADFMRSGQSQGGKKTATEAYSKDFFARLRLGARQAEVDNFVLAVGKKLFLIMQHEYDTKHFVKVAGKEGEYISQSYTKSDLDGEFDHIVQQGTGSQNKAYMAQTIAEGLKYTTGNPLINPKIWTDIVVDIFFDGVDTSKLMIPNAEQIANDPIAREQWRQIMLSIQQKSMLGQASAALAPKPQTGGGTPNQIPGGTPTPGAPEAMPTTLPPAGGV